jgi:hypothetical protein
MGLLLLGKGDISAARGYPDPSNWTSGPNPILLGPLFLGEACPSSADRRQPSPVSGESSTSGGAGWHTLAVPCRVGTIVVAPPHTPLLASIVRGRVWLTPLIPLSRMGSRPSKGLN